MAKISELPGADVLDGNETLPVVQRGRTARARLRDVAVGVVPFLQNWYRGDKGDPGGHVMAVGSFQQMRAGGTVIRSGVGLVQTNSWETLPLAILRSGRGAGLYVEDPAVLRPDESLNVFASADLSDTSWSDPVTSATRLALGDGAVRVTDDTTAMAQQVVQFVNAAVGQAYTTIWLVRKDAVGAAVRAPRLAMTAMLDPGTLGTRTGIVLDTSTGVGTLATEANYVAPDRWGVEDADGFWRVWITWTLPPGHQQMRVTTWPAAYRAGAASIEAMGSIDVAGVRMVAGQLADAVRATLEFNPRTTFAAPDENGVLHGWRLAPDQEITPYHFGAFDDLTRDSAPGLNAFSEFISRTACPRVNMGGAFAAWSTWYLGPASGLIASRVIGGECTVHSRHEEADVILVRGPGRATFGRIYAVCNGGQVFATRRNENGIRITGNASRSQFDFLYSINATNWGVFFDTNAGPNSNFCDFGRIMGFYNGSGARGEGASPFSLTFNYTVAGSSGSAEGTTQRTVLSVDAFPTDRTIAVNAPVQVQLGDRNYLVTGYDKAAGTLSVYPRLPADLPTTGAARYVFGGALGMAGNNANRIRGQLVDSAQCGRTVYMSGLYGCDIKTVSSAYAGSAVTVGRNTFGISGNNRIGSLYLENLTNFVEVEFLSFAGGLKVETMDSPTFSKWWDASLWRNAAGLLAGGEPFRYLQIQYDGETMDQLGAAGPRYAARDIPITPGSRARVRVADSPVFTITPDRYDRERIFGWQGTDVTVFGTTGPGFAPASVRFRCPAGATLNGGTTDVVFNGFAGPATFSVACIDQAARTYAVIRKNG